MKILYFLLLLWFGADLNAQISYEFSNTVPPQGSEVKKIDDMFHGTYYNSDTDFKYLISDTGIYVISTQYSKISKKTVRESSQYMVKKGFLFGVVKGDSIPCFLDGENYYFGIRNTIDLIGSKSANKLIRSASGVYYINFFEDGSYTPAKLVFSSNTLSISYFDYDGSTKLEDKVNSKTQKNVDGNTIYLLELNSEEWLKMNALVFGNAQTFQKEL